jgi:hypothetical protein
MTATPTGRPSTPGSVSTFAAKQRKSQGFMRLSQKMLKMSAFDEHLQRAAIEDDQRT